MYNMDNIITDSMKEQSINETFQMSNSSANSHILTELLIRNVIITFSYSLIVVVSLCGNILVCKTIWSKVPHTSTNVLIANLAFSDILMTIFNIPFTVVDILLTDWIFGRLFCTLVPFIQACCVYVSAFTMLVIAINRWRSIYLTKYRHRNRVAGRLCSKLIFVISMIWILAAIHSIPHTIYNDVVPMFIETPRREVQRCVTVPPDYLKNIQLWITIITFTTQYLIPLSISAVVYIRIGFTIASLGNVCSLINEEQRNQLCFKKRRRILLLVLIVLIFGICWLPFHIYYLLGDFKITNFNFKVFLVCHWLAMSSVCYNPFVYFWLNESFRNDAKNIIKFLLGMKDNSSEQIDNQLNNIDASCFYQNNITNTTNL